MAEPEPMGDFIERTKAPHAQAIVRHGADSGAGGVDRWLSHQNQKRDNAQNERGLWKAPLDILTVRFPPV